jgi:hypothetical protein
MQISSPKMAMDLIMDPYKIIKPKLIIGLDYWTIKSCPSNLFILIGKFGCKAVIVGVLISPDASIPADVVACGAPFAIS